MRQGHESRSHSLIFKTELSTEVNFPKDVGCPVIFSTKAAPAASGTLQESKLHVDWSWCRFSSPGQQHALAPDWSKSAGLRTRKSRTHSFAVEDDPGVARTPSFCNSFGYALTHTSCQAGGQCVPWGGLCLGHLIPTVALQGHLSLFGNQAPSPN